MTWLQDQLVAALQRHLANGDPDVPLAGMRIWQIFCDLNSTRQIGFAPCPISFLEIEAYSRMTRTPVRPFEIEIVCALDRALLDHVTKRAERPESVSTRPMSRGLFDALF